MTWVVCLTNRYRLCLFAVALLGLPLALPDAAVSSPQPAKRDSGKIVFDLFDGKDRSGVFQAQPNGTQVEKLLDSTHVVTAHRLSPDRKMLLYQRPVPDKDGRLERRYFLSVLTIKDKLAIDLEDEGRRANPQQE